MAFIFNPNKKRGLFMIPSGATKSPTPAPPSFLNTYSLAMDGVDDKLSVPESTYSGEFTFSFWAKPEINSNFVFGLSSSNGYFIWLVSATEIRIKLKTVGGSATQVIFTESGGNNIVLDEWQQIIITRDSSNNLNCYRNGTAFGSSGNNNKDFIFDSIGGGINFNTWDFRGNLDEVAVWNSDQSSNIGSIYSASGAVDLSSLNPTLWLRNGDNGSYKSPQWLIPNNINVANSRISNYSFSYDGVDDYVNAGSSIPNLETGDISFSAWVYPTSFSSYNYFLDSGAITTKKGIFAGLQITTGFVSISRRTGVTDTRCRTGFVDCGLTINNWYNIVGVYDEDGGTAGVGQLKLYVNGVLKATVDGSGQDTGTGYDLHIGKSENDFSHFVGNIDEVSFYNSPLTPENVTAIYNSGTPTTLPVTPVAHWKMGEEANFTDNWLVNNSALSNYSTRSFNFDGVDDSINCGNPTSLQITGALSISAWVKFTGNDVAIVSKYQSGGGAQRSYVLFGDSLGTTHNPSFIIYNSGSFYQALGATRIDDGNWHHLLGTFNPSTYVRLYVDGVLDGENTTSIPATIDNDPADFVIGASSNSTFLLSGNIDEVAVWNSDQSANIATIYSSGTPSDLTSLSPVSWWRMGEDATFNTNWSLPDNGSASNTGTSANMTIADLEGDAPNYIGGGLSANMTIEDRVGDAPNSTSNAVSFNMTESDRETDVPT